MSASNNHNNINDLERNSSCVVVGDFGNTNKALGNFTSSSSSSISNPSGHSHHHLHHSKSTSSSTTTSKHPSRLHKQPTYPKTILERLGFTSSAPIKDNPKRPTTGSSSLSTASRRKRYHHRCIQPSPIRLITIILWIVCVLWLTGTLTNITNKTITSTSSGIKSDSDKAANLKKLDDTNILDSDELEFDSETENEKEFNLNKDGFDRDDELSLLSHVDDYIVKGLAKSEKESLMKWMMEEFEAAENHRNLFFDDVVVDGDNSFSSTVPGVIPKLKKRVEAKKSGDSGAGSGSGSGVGTGSQNVNVGAAGSNKAGQVNGSTTDKSQHDSEDEDEDGDSGKEGTDESDMAQEGENGLSEAVGDDGTGESAFEGGAMGIEAPPEEEGSTVKDSRAEADESDSSLSSDDQVASQEPKAVGMLTVSKKTWKGDDQHLFKDGIPTCLGVPCSKKQYIDLMANLTRISKHSSRYWRGVDLAKITYVQQGTLLESCRKQLCPEAYVNVSTSSTAESNWLAARTPCHPTKNQHTSHHNYKSFVVPNYPPIPVTKFPRIRKLEGILERFGNLTKESHHCVRAMAPHSISSILKTNTKTNNNNNKKADSKSLITTDFEPPRTGSIGKHLNRARVVGDGFCAALKRSGTAAYAYISKHCFRTKPIMVKRKKKGGKNVGKTVGSSTMIEVPVRYVKIGSHIFHDPVVVALADSFIATSGDIYKLDQDRFISQSVNTSLTSTTFQQPPKNTTTTVITTDNPIAPNDMLIHLDSQCSTLSGLVWAHPQRARHLSEVFVASSPHNEGRGGAMGGLYSNAPDPRHTLINVLPRIAGYWEELERHPLIRIHHNGGELLKELVRFLQVDGDEDVSGGGSSGGDGKTKDKNQHVIVSDSADEPPITDMASRLVYGDVVGDVVYLPEPGLECFMSGMHQIRKLRDMIGERMKRLARRITEEYDMDDPKDLYPWLARPVRDGNVEFGFARPDGNGKGGSSSSSAKTLWRRNLIIVVESLPRPVSLYTDGYNNTNTANTTITTSTTLTNGSKKKPAISPDIQNHNPTTPLPIIGTGMRIANHEALVAALRLTFPSATVLSFPYGTVQSEKPIVDTLALFWGASVIISPHGVAVIEVLGENDNGLVGPETALCYSFLARGLGVSWYGTVAKAFGPRFRELVVDVDAIVAVVGSILGV
ncbi:hypothetical protein HDU76_012491 [Blyttiomyces sp. JEL0837]|nr:hypothetical protein HDU76_012491 [Blyttiomyces sp. JEL0837]